MSRSATVTTVAKGVRARFGVLSLLVLALLATAAGPAVAKSYWMPEVTIKATVVPDGSMRVGEARTFEFDGDYTRVYWDLEKTPDQDIVVATVVGPEGDIYKRIEDPAQIALRPPGTFAVTKSLENVRVEVFFKGTGRKTFKLDYIVKGAAKRWADTAELYWQFVGSGWAVSTGRVQGEVLLPPSVPADAV
jgi:hypothetical protein